MSLLTLIQSVAPRLSLPTPSAVVSSSDENLAILLALANEEGQELAERYRWQRLVEETTFSTVATPGDLVVVAPGFSYVVEGTVWNRSLDRKLHPINSEDWQQLQATGISGPTQYYRIWDNAFYIYPDPPAGQTIAFEYGTNLWCQSAGGTGRTAWAADDDTGILPEPLMALGVIWRWKATKGFDYAEDFRKYEAKVASAISRDGAKPTLDLSPKSRFGGIGRLGVSEGSWTL